MTSSRVISVISTLAIVWAVNSTPLPSPSSPCTGDWETISSCDIGSNPKPSDAFTTGLQKWTLGQLPTFSFPCGNHTQNVSNSLFVWNVTSDNVTMTKLVGNHEHFFTLKSGEEHGILSNYLPLANTAMRVLRSNTQLGVGGITIGTYPSGSDSPLFGSYDGAAREVLLSQELVSMLDAEPPAFVVKFYELLNDEIDNYIMERDDTPTSTPLDLEGLLHILQNVCKKFIASVEGGALKCVTCIVGFTFGVLIVINLGLEGLALKFCKVCHLSTTQCNGVLMDAAALSIAFMPVAAVIVFKICIGSCKPGAAAAAAAAAVVGGFRG